MSQPDDPRLERELRDAIDRRDPGPAPLALRERALRVPDEHPAQRTSAGRQALSGILGLAAVVALAVVVLTVAGEFRSAPVASFAAPSAPGRSADPGPTATAVVASLEPEPTPFVTVQPVVPTRAPGVVAPFMTSVADASASFDPYTVGPGLVREADDGSSLRALAMVGVLILIGFGITLRRRQRLMPFAVAAVLFAWMAFASLVPVSLGANGWGAGAAGMFTADATQPFGASENLVYVYARPGQPFAVMTSLGGEAPVPVRIEGIASPMAGRFSFYGIAWSAVWLDHLEDGGSSGPERPFAPINLSAARTLWLVGRASYCAVGPDFDPLGQDGANLSATTPGDSLIVQASVLGMPRRIEVKLPFTLVQPQGACSLDGQEPIPWPPTAPPAPSSPPDSFAP